MPLMNPKTNPYRGQYALRTPLTYEQFNKDHPSLISQPLAKTKRRKITSTPNNSLSNQKYILYPPISPQKKKGRLKITNKRLKIVRYRISTISKKRFFYLVSCKNAHLSPK